MMGETAGTTAHLAGFWRRFASSFIDGILLSIPEYILFLVAGKSIGVFYGASFVLGAIYYTWGFGSGQTLGCRALNLRIVDQQSGRMPGSAKGFLRFLVYQILLSTFFLALLDGLWMIWDGKKQTWHDKIANTLVVDAGGSSDRGMMSEPTV